MPEYITDDIETSSDVSDTVTSDGDVDLKHFEWFGVIGVIYKILIYHRYF